MATELPKNTDPDELGPDPDTVRAAMRERDSAASERDTSPEQRIMDDRDMGEDEHPDDRHGDSDAPAG